LDEIAVAASAHEMSARFDPKSLDYPNVDCGQGKAQCPHRFSQSLKIRIITGIFDL
jgi:hypothetical protein